MKIILKRNHENLGEVGEIVTVKAGFARNYLIPNGYAMAATDGNMKLIEQEKKRLEAAALREQKEAEVLADKLNKVSVTAEVQVGEEDRVFGAVTTQNIAELLKEKGFEIDRRRIVLEEPLKELGIFEVPVKLHAAVQAQIKVWVVKRD